MRISRICLCVALAGLGAGQIIFAAPAVLSITTAGLPAGQLQSAYSATLAATGGTTAFAYLTDVQNVAAQRQNLVPFTQFFTDLGNGTLPNYSLLRRTCAMTRTIAHFPPRIAGCRTTSPAW